MDIRHWMVSVAWLLAGLAILGPRPVVAAEDIPEPSAVLCEVLEVGQVIVDPGPRDALFTEVGCALARAGRFEEAGRAARAIRFANWRCSVLRSLAEGQAKAGDFAAAMWTIGAIDDPASEYHRSEALRRMALSQVRGGDLAGALATLPRAGRQLGLHRGQERRQHVGYPPPPEP